MHNYVDLLYITGNINYKQTGFTLIVKTWRIANRFH